MPGVDKPNNCNFPSKAFLLIGSKALFRLLLLLSSLLEFMVFSNKF